NLLATSRRTCGTKPFLTLGSVQESFGFVIANYQPIKGTPRRVPTDDKLLSSVNLVLDPCAGSFTRLVEGVLALGYDALETELSCNAHQIGGGGVDAL